MSKLNGWFGEKTKKVANDMDALQTLEEERAQNEDEIKLSHGDVEKGIQEREMRSFVTLNKFYKKLNKHAKAGSEKAKQRAKLASKSTGLIPDEDIGTEKLEMDIAELRNRLLNKEDELRKNLLADGSGEH